MDKVVAFKKKNKTYSSIDLSDMLEIVKADKKEEATFKAICDGYEIEVSFKKINKNE